MLAFHSCRQRVRYIDDVISILMTSWHSSGRSEQDVFFRNLAAGASVGAVSAVNVRF